MTMTHYKFLEISRTSSWKIMQHCFQTRTPHYLANSASRDSKKGIRSLYWSLGGIIHRPKNVQKWKFLLIFLFFLFLLSHFLIFFFFFFFTYLQNHAHTHTCVRPLFIMVINGRSLPGVWRSGEAPWWPAAAPTWRGESCASNFNSPAQQTLPRYTHRLQVSTMQWRPSSCLCLGRRLTCAQYLKHFTPGGGQALKTPRCYNWQRVQLFSFWLPSIISAWF